MSTAALKKVLARLKSLGNETTLAHYRKSGAQGTLFGVPMGEIRKVAADIGNDHALAVELWDSKIIDAQLLALLLFKPKDLSMADVDRMVRSIAAAQVADWFSANITRKHPARETLRERWLKDSHSWAARAGWSLTADRVGKDVAGLDLPALLDRIEAEMVSAPAEVQWTMNFCLAGIGIHSPKHRRRAMAIGEKLGMYRDYPVSKGCTSPFAPIWIDAMVKRQTDSSRP